MTSPAKAQLDQGAKLLQQGRAADAEKVFRQLKAADPRGFLATYNLAVAVAQQGRLAEAERLMAEALAINPAIAPAVLAHGKILMDLGRVVEALAAFDKFIAAQPGNVDALNDRAIALLKLKRYDDAAACLTRLLALNPNHHLALYNLASAEESLGRPVDALARLDKAVTLAPDFAEAHFFRGNLLRQLKRLGEALVAFDAALALRPRDAKTINNRGTTLMDMERYADALACFDAALDADRGYLEALVNRGRALGKLGRTPEEVACYDAALALRPDFVEAWLSRGVALQNLKRFDEGLASIERALALAPGHAKGLQALGNVLAFMLRNAEAVAAYERALAVDPDDAGTWHNHALALRQLNLHEEAGRSFARALALKPDYPFAMGALFNARLNCCDWTDYAATARAISEAVLAGRKVDNPFSFLCHSGSPAAQLACANIFAADKIAGPIARWTAPPHRNAKIRLAYVSADFRNHATAHLMAGLFEAHDRAKFEVTAVAIAPTDGSDMDRRLRAAFDRFIDASGVTDAETARMLRELKTDIAVDLKGFTNEARYGIFAQRAAPLQVNFLGYPCTWGGEAMDYIVADKTLIPPEHAAHYAEKVAWLPDSYQPNDRKRVIGRRVPTRAEAGLPPEGFVFASFNNNYKITPEVFDAWMDLLKRVPGSVLWLFEGTAAAARNLAREAEARGVAASRLVFAKRLDPADHLARHALADLFLDTLPVNAHTTASDALWAGLPVLTILGTAFAGRVAASLLRAVGLPELVAPDLAAYRAIALDLATDPGKLAALTAKLARNRDTTALFDTGRFCRHLEAAFTTMVQRYEGGQPPASFAVPALP